MPLGAHHLDADEAIVAFLLTVGLGGIVWGTPCVNVLRVSSSILTIPVPETT
ncbi:hypothetical protein MPLB_1570010 [Mesorhizobium sp. ORS 3324]|nr:hypothetical protein MPLB_1570010 [Mesorhizobium sp. ORS 3324]